MAKIFVIPTAFLDILTNTILCLRGCVNRIKIQNRHFFSRCPYRQE